MMWCIVQSRQESEALSVYYGRLWNSNLPKRIKSKFRVLGPDDCWEWQGAYTAYGRYGHAWKPGATRENPCIEYTHIIVYEAVFGPVPSGLRVLHSCDNGICGNLAHLRAGTQSDNLKEASDKGRMFKPGRFYRKLTPDQVREIRKSPELDTVIAYRYGMSPGGIWHVRKRTTYADVED